ncbi:MAG: ATP-binding protein [Mediterranea sp.]|jgi:predicted AAA+ superfamily ATPase|nr:ATP-binding protein [Mediterranea sp.]
MSKKYLRRNIDKELLAWKEAERHKPLLLRGARQVGKSSTVRELGQRFVYFVEVNFERDDKELRVKSVFERGTNPKRICEELSLIYGQPIIPGKTLLFLDEVQACVPAITSLRYFYEEYPELHVIAAGSLLEFALQELPSFGVGRIHSQFLYPFSFDEYLRAMEMDHLADAIQNASPETPLPEAVHAKCTQLLTRFILIGGMPEVVSTYARSGSLLDCQQALNELTLSLYDDFSKYKQRVPTARLREVFSAVIHQTGDKFVYANVSPEFNRPQIKESIGLLELAGIIYPVTHTAANGLPLAAEMNTKFRKWFVLDTGIYQRFLRLDLNQLFASESLRQVNKGALAEMFVGLEILKAAPSTYPTQLYYWQREKHGSLAEVDYVIQRDADILPVEVKAGTRGSMQSMFQFMAEKRSAYGIRCSLENFGSFRDIKIYPLYAASRITR